MREIYFDSEFNAFEDFAINGAIKSFIDSGEVILLDKVQVLGNSNLKEGKYGTDVRILCTDSITGEHFIVSNSSGGRVKI